MKKKKKKKHTQRYLDSEIINGFGSFFSHLVRRRRCVCEIVEEETETQKEKRDPVA